MKPAEASVAKSIRLPLDLAAALVVAAAQSGKSQNQLITEALRLWLQKSDTKITN